MSKDPYKYFRIEAREILEGLGQGILELEKIPSKELVSQLLRLAHTLKGASRVVKVTSVATHAHAIEEALQPYRDGQGPLARSAIEKLLSLTDSIAKEIVAIDMPAAAQAAEAPPRLPKDEVFETVRVELEEMDALLEGVTETTVQFNALAREGDALERARSLAEVLVDQLNPRRDELDGSNLNLGLAKAYALAEDLSGSLQRIQQRIAGGVEQVHSELEQVREAANRLRLLPVNAISAPLERAVRDAAQSLQKDVGFHLSGGDSRLDAHVLGPLRDALLHVVRNAVAHGIESESERRTSGKPAQGRVELAVIRVGDRIAFRCRDDGRGIDVAALERAAIRAGVISASERGSQNLQDIVQLILRGGLSTTETITEVSGRGIGLDVVREAAARLKGQVRIESEPGRGTMIEISVPVSLSSLEALFVEVDGVTASLPLDAVKKTLRLDDAQIARTSERDSIVWGGRVIPFLALATTLGKQSSKRSRPRAYSAVVIQSGVEYAAIGVDRLAGTSAIVVLPPPSDLVSSSIVAGASLDAEGIPQLVLDAHALVNLARAGRAATTPVEEISRLPVLIIDDSLTTRMLEQSILESAGYEVELATSAEEGLLKAGEKRYSLFLVDVEMPGMDGFQFVTQTRAHPTFREIPAILVTSRGSVDDLRRGKEAGAHAYIVKGEFNQGELLKTIRGLIG